MFANLARAGITAVILAAIAAAPLFAPAELGVLATGEEIAISEAAGVGEGAPLVEVGDEVGESVSEAGEIGSLPPETGSGPPETGGGDPPETDGGDPPETEGGDPPETEGGDPPETEGGDPPETEGGDPPETDGGDPPNNNDGEGPGSTGGGRDEDTVSTEDGKKRVPGVKMPWDTKPSYAKNGSPKTRGWHRVASGKTSVLANFLTPFTATVSRHHHIWIRWCITDLPKVGGPSLESAICSQFPNAKPEDLEKWTKLLADRILQGGEDYRSMIDYYLKEMNHGNGFGDNGKSCKPAKAPRALKVLILFFRYICGAFPQYLGRNDLSWRLRTTDGL